MSDKFPKLQLALDTLERVKADPNAWDQTEWHCGSAGCFAWHVGAVAGAEPAIQGDTIPWWEYMNHESLESYVASMAWQGPLSEKRRQYLKESGARKVENRDFMVIPPGLTKQDKIEIYKYARDELGLSQKDSNLLFDSKNTLEDLEEMIQELAATGTLREEVWGDCGECGERGCNGECLPPGCDEDDECDESHDCCHYCDNGDEDDE